MFIRMNCSVAGPYGALLCGVSYDLPKALALKILAKKIAGSDVPAAEVEVDPARIKKARKGLEIPVQAQTGGEGDNWEGEE